MRHMGKNFSGFFFLALLSLLLLAGCGGGGGGNNGDADSGSNDASNTLKVNAPTVDLPAVVTGSYSVATVSAYITPTNITPSRVTLYRVDSNGEVISTLGELNDDGTNGDKTTKDHAYSIQITFAETVAGSVDLRIGLIDASLSNEVFSEVFSIPIINIANIQSNTEYNDEVDLLFNNFLNLRDGLSALSSTNTNAINNLTYRVF